MEVYNKNQDWIEASFYGGHKKFFLRQHKLISGLIHCHNREYMYLNAILFKERDDDLGFWSNGGVFLDESLNETISSAQEIKKFPFVPKVFTIKVDIKKNNGKTTYFIKDKEKLKEVWDYYKHPETKRNLIEKL